jgi:hypothetical protein
MSNSNDDGVEQTATPAHHLNIAGLMRVQTALAALDDSPIETVSTHQRTLTLLTGLGEGSGTTDINPIAHRPYQGLYIVS